MNKFTHMLVAAFSLAIAPVANATIIDFEGVNVNNVNSFTIGDATFTDSMGSGLTTANYGHQSDGTGLAVWGDDASRLQISFANTYNYLSFDFGNDDPGWGGGTDAMHLDLYLNGMLTGSFALTANWDDIMNQTLTGTGMFNYVEIYYDVDLIEVVDNLEFRMDVPEPASLALLGLGLVGVGFSRKKKSA